MAARPIVRVPVLVRRAALALAGAVAMSLPFAPVGWAQATPETLSHPPSATTTESRACRNAKARLASEERLIGKTQHSIDTAREGSTRCTTKPVCDQYVNKITELETLRTRREAKLTKYHAAADRACVAR